MASRIEKVEVTVKQLQDGTRDWWLCAVVRMVPESASYMRQMRVHEGCFEREGIPELTRELLAGGG